MITGAVRLRAGAVTCVDEFLDAAELACLHDDLRHTYWWKSPVLRLHQHAGLVAGHSIGRTSSTTDETWLGGESQELLRAVERRLAPDLGVAVEQFEPWQVARYRAGERFEEHHDSGFFAGDRWGERRASVLIYLSDSPSGGSTYFPALGERFQPVAGRLLIWPDLLPDGRADPMMRHVACPARRVKTIVSTWVRERPTRTTPTH